MDSTTPSAPRSGISRRTVVAGAAWAAPVVAIAPAAQAATCSKICVTYAGTACKSPGNSDPLNRKAYKYLFTIENQTGGLPPYNGCMQVLSLIHISSSRVCSPPSNASTRREGARHTGPVSYTHLVNLVVARHLGVVDFGRLATLTLAVDITVAIAGVGMGSALVQFGAKAVSYTHLDVYKRQVRQADDPADCAADLSRDPGGFRRRLGHQPVRRPRLRSDASRRSRSPKGGRYCRAAMEPHRSLSLIHI